MSAKKARIAVLVSGGGTNLQALIDAQKSGELKSGELCMVISDRSGAFGLERARLAGIPSAFVGKKQSGGQEAFERTIADTLEKHGIDLIVLAGFLSILSADFTRRFDGRIINIHPSLIPAFCGEGFYGLKVHEAALARGVKISGATVHYVNEIPDGGEIIMQKAVGVYPGDTPESLQLRIMEQAEWVILPKAVESICAGIVCGGKDKAMDIYRISDIAELLKGNPYVGRGIIIGTSEDAKSAVCAYFITGRSANSRNRVFALKGEDLYTQPFDASKVEDPSLIIYAALRTVGDKIIVTNGDQTDTLAEGLKAGKSFEEALESRSFEPDAPNLTPRISGMASLAGGEFSYRLSILKSTDAQGSGCARYSFSYPSKAGLGHFIRTYACDGDPLPAFQGEPERVAIPSCIDSFADAVWNALDADNRISLYVRYTDIRSGEYRDRLINKHSGGM